ESIKAHPRWFPPSVAAVRKTVLTQLSVFALASRGTTKRTRKAAMSRDDNVPKRKENEIEQRIDREAGGGAATAPPGSRGDVQLAVQIKHRWRSPCPVAIATT